MDVYALSSSECLWKLEPCLMCQKIFDQWTFTMGCVHVCTHVCSIQSQQWHSIVCIHMWLELGLSSGLVQPRPALCLTTPSYYIADYQHNQAWSTCNHAWHTGAIIHINTLQYAVCIRRWFMHTITNCLYYDTCTYVCGCIREVAISITSLKC